jgi:hypothetical protein
MIALSPSRWQTVGASAPPDGRMSQHGATSAKTGKRVNIDTLYLTLSKCGSGKLGLSPSAHGAVAPCGLSGRQRRPELLLKSTTMIRHAHAAGGQRVKRRDRMPALLLPLPTRPSSAMRAVTSRRTQSRRPRSSRGLLQALPAKQAPGNSRGSDGNAALVRMLSTMRAPALIVDKRGIVVVADALADAPDLQEHDAGHRRAG